MTRFNLASHGNLLWSLVNRDIRARYRGSWLGLFWAILNPVLLLVVYYYVFNFIFQVKLPALYGEREVPFAGFIFAGLILYFLFAEVLTKSTTVIADNTNYIKKVVFPVEIIPATSVLVSVFNFLVSLLILSAYLMFSGHGLSMSVVALPLIIIPFILFLAGLAWLLSALGVYLRDITYVAGFLATAMMFLAPVFYPMQSVPESLKAIMAFNPLTYFIETFRHCIIGGMFPTLQMLIIPWMSGLLTCVLGYCFFQRVRHGFADVL